MQWNHKREKDPKAHQSVSVVVPFKSLPKVNKTHPFIVNIVPKPMMSLNDFFVFLRKPCKNQLPNDVLTSHDIISTLHPLRHYHFIHIHLQLHFYTPRHTLHSLFCILFWVLDVKVVMTHIKELNGLSPFQLTFGRFPKVLLKIETNPQEGTCGTLKYYYEVLMKRFAYFQKMVQDYTLYIIKPVVESSETFI